MLFNVFKVEIFNLANSSSQRVLLEMVMTFILSWADCLCAGGFVLKLLQDSAASERRCLCLCLCLKHRCDGPTLSDTVQPEKSWTLASCTWTHTVTLLPLCVCVSCLTFGQLLFFSIDPSLVSISQPDCCGYLHVSTLTNFSHYILLCFLTELQTKPVLLSLFQSVTDWASSYTELASHVSPSF